MRYYKVGRSVLVSLLVVLSASFVPRLPMVLMTSGVLAQTVDARKAEADRLLEQGNQQFNKGEIEAASQFWEQALKIYREIKDSRGEGTTLGNLGIVYNVLGDYEKAIEFYQQHLAIAKQIGDRAGESLALGNLGIAYTFLGDYKQAIEFYQQQLAIAKQIGDRAGISRVLGNLGLAYYNLGDYEKAIELLQQTSAISKELGDLGGEGKTLNNLGNAYRSQGDYEKAINSHQKSLAIFKQIGDRANESLALGNLGSAYDSQGNYKKAIDFYQQSLTILKQIGNRTYEGSVLGNLGGTYASLGDYKKAIEFYIESLEIAQELGYRNGEAKILSNLGNLYSELGDYKKAIELHQKSLVIAKEIGNRAGEAGTLVNLTGVHSSLGEYQKAIDLSQQALAIFKEIGDRAGEGNALGNLGYTYSSTGEYKKAIDFKQQALAIFKEIGDRAGEGTVLNSLGYDLFKSGNLAEAEKILKQGIKVWKFQRIRQEKDEFKINIFEGQSNTYRTLQQVLIAQNKTDAALQVAESGRARAFVDLLTNRLSPDGDIFSATEPTINQIKQIAKAQNSTLIQYSIIHDEFKIAGKQQWKQSELYIWVIKPTGEITFRKADLKHLWQKENTTLSELVSSTRKSLGVGDDERSIFDVKVKNPANEKIQKESLQKLHQLLVTPIADLLPTDPNQRVTFVPQSDLFLVPFPALMDNKGKYLIEKHTILTAPAIQVLELTRQQRERIKKLPGTNQKNALIVGNPTMPSFNTKYGESGKQLSSLPGAKREAQAIAPLFNTKALTGDEATETTIKAKLPQAGLIHLATHGLFDGFQGLQSSIALAPSSQDNGLLTASEILDIKLNADLVVLSACNTGRGRITGDGVIGLSRSLISAGVPSVLVSLWSVPDSPTASLMTDFYQNLSKNPDKATALRQAMLTRMKQHPNPRDWAAFTLIGEAE
ncbi:MAG: tetratricopeptide repeat protein [Rivularia sp. (in: Bacteria)]|nr:tetratricopeptide repeat protein [Rivularia sp. MS3]